MYGKLIKVAKHIPMRRELKDDQDRQSSHGHLRVAKHIPMRRELKVEFLSSIKLFPGMSQSTSR